METINGARPINAIITENAKLELICVEIGLTKREYFAGLAMQGLIAGRWACPDNVPNDVETIVEQAVIHADRLLEKLEKK